MWKGTLFFILLVVFSVVSAQDPPPEPEPAVTDSVDPAADSLEASDLPPNLPLLLQFGDKYWTLTKRNDQNSFEEFPFLKYKAVLQDSVILLRLVQGPDGLFRIGIGTEGMDDLLPVKSWNEMPDYIRQQYWQREWMIEEMIQGK